MLLIIFDKHIKKHLLKICYFFVKQKAQFFLGRADRFWDMADSLLLKLEYTTKPDATFDTDTA